MKLPAYDGTSSSDTQLRKYDNNGKDRYIRCDDDNKMSYKYILSITSTYSPTYCEENKEGIWEN